MPRMRRADAIGDSPWGINDSVNVQRDENGQIWRITKDGPDGSLAGVWERGHGEVWVASFAYKDEFRRLVERALGHSLRSLLQQPTEDDQG